MYITESYMQRGLRRAAHAHIRAPISYILRDGWAGAGNTKTRPALDTGGKWEGGHQNLALTSFMEHNKA